MALSYWTRDQLQARVFANLMQQDSDDNDLLSATQVQDALYLGEMALARDARTHRRAGDITAVDEQAEYNLPEDMPVVVDVTWDDDTEPLRMTDEANLAKSDPGYRQEAAAEPEYWYQRRSSTLSLYPPPDVTDETFEVDGYCMPFQIGGGITSISRTSSVVTVTTNAPHKLRVGDSVTISGSDQSEWNAAWTVVTAPTSTTFTVTSATGDNTTTDCYLYYTGGLLPMLAGSDVSDFPTRYRPAVADFATWWLSSTQLAGDPAAVAAGQEALKRYEWLKMEYLKETAV